MNSWNNIPGIESYKQKWLFMEAKADWYLTAVLYHAYFQITC